MRHILVIAMILSFAFGAFAEEAAVVEATAEDVAKAQEVANNTKVGFENAISTKEEVKKEKKKSSKKSKQKTAAKKKKSNWNRNCKDLLDTSVKSTIALEKTLKKKKKLTREEFDEKVHEELLVVQLNAWVCALSSKKKVGSINVEEQFLKDYSRRIQDRQM